MCRRYTIKNYCGHERRETRLCFTGATCPLTNISLTLDHFCRACDEDLLSFLLREIPPFENMHADGLRDISVQGLKLLKNFPIPEGQEGPFSGRITGQDLELLENLEKYVEILMRGPSELQKDFQELLGCIHRSIEETELDVREDEYLLQTRMQRQEEGTALPELLASVDVMDLKEDERDCHVCMQAYVSGMDEDRVKEKPCKLPCGHVFGKDCIKRTFQEWGLNCPLCRTAFNPNDYEPKEVVSPWWMSYLRGEWELTPGEDWARRSWI